MPSLNAIRPSGVVSPARVLPLGPLVITPAKATLNFFRDWYRAPGLGKTFVVALAAGALIESARRCDWAPDNFAPYQNGFFQNAVLVTSASLAIGLFGHYPLMSVLPGLFKAQKAWAAMPFVEAVLAAAPQAITGNFPGACFWGLQAFVSGRSYRHVQDVPEMFSRKTLGNVAAMTGLQSLALVSLLAAYGFADSIGSGSWKLTPTGFEDQGNLSLLGGYRFLCAEGNFPVTKWDADRNEKLTPTEVWDGLLTESLSNERAYLYAANLLGADYGNSPAFQEYYQLWAQGHEPFIGWDPQKNEVSIEPAASEQTRGLEPLTLRDLVAASLIEQARMEGVRNNPNGALHFLLQANRLSEHPALVLAGWNSFSFGAKPLPVSGWIRESWMAPAYQEGSLNVVRLQAEAKKRVLPVMPELYADEALKPQNADFHRQVAERLKQIQPEAPFTKWCLALLEVREGKVGLLEKFVASKLWKDATVAGVELDAAVSFLPKIDDKDRKQVRERQAVLEKIKKWKADYGKEPLKPKAKRK